MGIEEQGKSLAKIHIEVYEEVYGKGNVKSLIETGDFDTQVNKDQEARIENEGYRQIDENMFGGPEGQGRILIYLRNEIEQ